MKKIAIYTFLLLIIILNYKNFAYSHLKRHKVLVLHSYHQGLIWTDNITKGILDTFKPIEDQVEIYIEYLDTKRNINKKYLNSLVNLYREKIRNINYEVIIVSDNNALNFIKLNRKKYFREIPIVFCGINNFSDQMIDNIKKITGVVEDTDFKSTINLIKQIHTDCKKLYIINDDKTTTGIMNKQKLQRDLLEIKLNCEIIYLENLAIAELLNTVKNFKRGDIIYLLTFNRDKNGVFVSYREGVELISQYSNVPIYGAWDFYLGKGIVGGMLTSGYLQGKNAAFKAKQILNGHLIEGISIMKSSPNKFMFDQNILDLYGIDKIDLPLNSVIINQKESFYSRYKVVIIVSIFLILIFSVIILNVSLKKRKAEEAYIHSEKRYQLLADVAYEGIVLHKNGNIIDVNESFCRMSGYCRDEIIGQHIAHFVATESLQVMKERIKNKNENPYEVKGIKKDGTIINVEIRARQLNLNNENIRVAVLWDITERIKMEQKIKDMALHDFLTGLHNRLYFKERISISLSEAKRYNTKLALLFIDVDDFKDINDTYGHEAGDIVLKKLADKIKNNLREVDTVVRYGGDEFVVILEKIKTIEDIEFVIDKINNSIEQEIFIEDHKIYSSISIGVSIYPDDSEKIEELLKISDANMYNSKSNKKQS